jgi:hypothetical protein
MGLVLLASSANATPRLDRAVPGAPPTAAVCPTGHIRCFAHVRTNAAGEIQAFDAGDGWGPADLQAAYQIDPNITTTPTVAIVDAYGYANLESDLAPYRSQFGLPPCTQANGCLTIVNQNGAASPLPAEPPPDDDWTIETALDVDMASAACPKCKLLVVQADDTSDNLYTAQDSAAAAHPTVISDSWGSVELADPSSAEVHMNHPGIAEFVSGGDSGWDDGGSGPLYPSTSAYTIAVGGTSLYSATGGRGFAESAWSSGGSSCSASIAKPSYQTSSACAYRAANDISAVGDPATGVSVYNANNGGFMVIGGTSAAAPLVAALFASIGHGDVTAAQIAQASSALFDVTSGSNGSCGSILCTATTGWDGPTGFGTPSAAELAGGGSGGGMGTLAVQFTSPANGALVQPGFEIDIATNGIAVAVGIDGNEIGVSQMPPFAFTTPATVAPGAHVLQVVAEDSQGNKVAAEINVTVAGTTTTPPPPTGDAPDQMVGCNAARGCNGLVVVFAIAVMIRRRRR